MKPLYHGNYAVYEIAARNNMGNSSFVTFPKSQNSVVRFVINGTTANPLVYPSGVEYHIQAFIDKKLTDRQANRRRRMLQDGNKAICKSRKRKSTYIFGSSNKSFTHYLRVGRLFESELTFVSTQLSSTDFLNDLKELDGFNSSSSFWEIPVSNIVAVPIRTSTSKPLLPKLIFDGYLDRKAVFEMELRYYFGFEPQQKIYDWGGGSSISIV